MVSELAFTVCTLFRIADGSLCRSLLISWGDQRETLLGALLWRGGKHEREPGVRLSSHIRKIRGSSEQKSTYHR